MAKKKEKLFSIFIKFNKDEFNKLNIINKEHHENDFSNVFNEEKVIPSFLYPYELIQYQPFGENIWYEVKLLDPSQKEVLLSLVGGKQSTGKMIEGAISANGEINGNGSYVQEVNSEDMIITKFIKSEDIKSNHKVLI